MTETARLVLAVDSSPVRKATADLDNLAKGGKRAEGVVENLKGKLAGIAIGTAVVAGISAIVQKTIEAEKVQAQLAAVLKSTGGAAGLTAKQLNDMADGLQAVTTYDDEAITGAQSLLLTFTNIGGSVFPKATEAVLNMSTALGQDLKSSAVQLGKALNDPIEGINALRRVGVNFTDAQKDVIEKLVETGHVADAQRLILQELETEFGNSARAARDTLGGALEGLKNDFENLLEGDSGGDGIRGAKEAVDDLGETMRSQSVKDGFAAMISGLANVASFAAKAIAAVTGLGNAVAQQMSPNDKKTYDGLLTRRFELEDRKGLLEREGIGTGSLLRNLATVGVGPDLAEVNKELAEVEARLSHLRATRKSANTPTADTFALDGQMTTHGGDDPLWGTDKGGRKGGTSAAEKAARDAARAAEEAAEANADYRRTLEDLRAEMGGPLAQVQLEYTRREDELIALAKKGGIGNAELAESLDLLEAARQKEVKAIEDQLTPAEQLLSDMRFEHSLLGMTNAERQTAIDLRQLEGKATAAQASEIRDLNEAFEAEQKKLSVMDEFRANVQDTFASILDGSKSAKEAFTDLADSIVAQIARMVAQRWVDQLFGAQGTMGGGSMGGGIFSFLGSLFGGGGSAAAGGATGFLSAFGSGGYAMGTTNAPGGWSTVGENGPEQMYVPRGARIEPAHRSRRKGRGGDTHVHVQGVLTRETVSQVATRTARSVRMAQRN